MVIINSFMHYLLINRDEILLTLRYSLLWSLFSNFMAEVRSASVGQLLEVYTASE